MLKRFILQIRSRKILCPLCFVRKGAAFSTFASSTNFRKILYEVDQEVAVLTFNTPKKYNAWTQDMLEEMSKAFDLASSDTNTKVLVLTGSGKYYCAGVDLSSVLRPMRPSVLHELVRKHNQQLFDKFLDFPKPIIAAVNGPAIGAAATSATLCDAVLASEAATFSTPFTALGLVPEGCSSVHFPHLMGHDKARKMLNDGWKPTSYQALDIGLITKVIPNSKCTNENQDDYSKTLVTAAIHLAQEWIAEGFQRRLVTGEWDLDQLKKTNAKESHELATAFLKLPFLMAQRDFAKSRGKTKLAIHTGSSILCCVDYHTPIMVAGPK